MSLPLGVASKQSPDFRRTNPAPQIPARRVSSEPLHVEGVSVGLTEMEDVFSVAGDNLIFSGGGPDYDYSIDDVRCARTTARSSG